MLERCFQDVRTMLRSGATPPKASVARSAKLNNKNTILTKPEINLFCGNGGRLAYIGQVFYLKVNKNIIKWQYFSFFSYFYLLYFCIFASESDKKDVTCVNQ